MPEPITFDDQGMPVAGEAPQGPPPLELPEEIEDAGAEPEHEVEAAEKPAQSEAEADARYKIGNKTFKTLEEAHNYATSHISTLETEQQIADAYRLGIRDAGMPAQQSPQVTPEPEDDINEQEFYENPKQFLKKFASNIKQQTQAEINQQQAVRQQADQVWSEFAAQHPNLADFRRETEEYVNANTDLVRGIAQTKGRNAAYDYIATKLRAQFARYAEATKPRRDLNNGATSTTPTSRGPSVTPKKSAPKVLSIKDQIRSIKKN